MRQQFHPFLLVLPFLIVGPAWADQPSDDLPDSPRIAALAKSLKGGDRRALEQFWAELRGKAPLIEPIQDNKEESWVTFIWRGNESTRRVNLLSGLPDLTTYSKALSRLEGTNLWYRTERVPNTARFSYYFCVNCPQEIVSYPRRTDRKKVNDLMDKLTAFADPFNREILYSAAELPRAPPQRWIQHWKDAPKGTMHAHTLASKIIKKVPQIWVYTPTGYDAERKPSALLVMFDGLTHGGDPKSTHMPIPTIIDNLMADRKIPSTVTVLVDNVEWLSNWRHENLSCSEGFADFLVQELVPWVRSHYRVTADPAQAVIAGESDGGLAAARVALRHPEVFGCVLSQSGSFGFNSLKDEERWTPYAETGWLIRQFIAAPKQKLRFYLTVGAFEHCLEHSTRDENRRMRDVLLAKGYPVTYQEFMGGHDSVCWRGFVGDGLIFLLGAKDTKHPY
jgi:enterochelin esterase-like enzyme